MRRRRRGAESQITEATEAQMAPTTLTYEQWCESRGYDKETRTYKEDAK